MSKHEAKFQVGQIIHHKLFDYIGVVFDVDPTFQGTTLSGPPVGNGVTLKSEQIKPMSARRTASHSGNKSAGVCLTKQTITASLTIGDGAETIMRVGG